MPSTYATTTHCRQRDPGVRFLPEAAPVVSGRLGRHAGAGLGPASAACRAFAARSGPFLGLSGSIDGRVVDGGFAPMQTQRGAYAGLDLSFRAGFGLDGVMGERGDGLVYGSIGFRSDAPSTNRFNDTLRRERQLQRRHPGARGTVLRFRMPFYVIPGDLLLMSPLYFIDRKTYTNMAVTAANGGLIPWQSGWATAIGRFQLVLGASWASRSTACTATTS
jgi:hypothetical protein